MGEGLRRPTPLGDTVNNPQLFTKPIIKLLMTNVRGRKIKPNRARLNVAQSLLKLAARWQGQVLREPHLIAIAMIELHQAIYKVIDGDPYEVEIDRVDISFAEFAKPHYDKAFEILMQADTLLEVVTTLSEDDSDEDSVEAGADETLEDAEPSAEADSFTI